MFKVYDSNEVAVSIAGIPITGGFDDGAFLRIERDTDVFGDKVGTDGEVTRFKNNDDRANATIILMQTAAANDLLSALLLSDQNAPNGFGVGRFLVQDLNGRSIHEAAHAWVMDFADVEYGREATAREWPIRIARLQTFVGGT